MADVFRRTKSGKHPERQLTALQVKSLSQPGRYADGNGLYLVVSATGGKHWILRTVVNGARRDIGLGGAALTSLAEAREAALQMRKQARSGGDPLAERRRRREVLTFKDAAETVHEQHRGAWKNAKHIQQWINTLTQYAIPVIGDLQVDKIGTPDIMRVLSPIWLEKPETARRVRQRLNTVFDWAKASGYRTGDNPVEGVSKGLPKQTDRDVHHAALPYAAVPAFVARLRAASVDQQIVCLAFEFLILTASRTGEVLGCRKSEIDLDEKIWHIPAERMKAKNPHRVPLSGRALEIIGEASAVDTEAAFLFPGRGGTTPLSNMVFLMMLRRMAVEATAHGFRSSFRDWVSEATVYPNEIAEMALAHTVANKVEAAYRRGDLLERRRNMMEEWAVFLSGATDG